MPKPPSPKLVIAVVIILTVAGVGYAGLMSWRDRTKTETQDGEFASEVESKVELPSPHEQGIPEIDAADWKTYRNDEVGFEFRYPPYLNIGRTLLPDGPFDPGLEGSIISTFSDGRSAELVISVSSNSLDGYIVHNNPGGEYYRFDKKTNRWMYMDTDIAVEEPRLLDASVTAYGYHSGDATGLWYGAVVPDPLDNYVLELILIGILGEEQDSKSFSQNIRDVLTRVVNTLRFHRPGS